MVTTDLRNAPDRAQLEDDLNRESLQLCVQRCRDSSSPERYQFEQGFAVIGSADTCHLQLDDPGVPARALYVQQLTDRVVFVPLDDASVDQPAGDSAVPRRRPVHYLPAGFPVKLGPFQVWQSAVVPSELEGLPRIGEKPLPSFAEPIAVWDIANVKGDQLARRSRHLRHALTLVGSGPACRFRMVHDSISQIHASLVYVHGDLQVIDLCSEHGVCVNGRRVAQAILTDGDELQIGQCHGVIRWLVPLRQAPQNPQPVELSPFHVTEATPDDGIVVSLSDSGLDIRDVPGCPREDFASDLPSYSDEYCLALVTQFLEMQQSVLKQTQLLMQKISERLQTGTPPASADEIRSEKFGDQSTAKPKAEANVVRSDRQVTSPRRKTQPRSSAPIGMDAAPAPEFHAWLTHQLAELESSQRTGFSRLWERLTGLK